MKKAALLLWLGPLTTATAWSCVGVSTTTFLNVTSQNLSLNWANSCSTVTIHYSEIDDDAGFASPLQQTSSGPPVVFGSTTPLNPDTLYFARVSTVSFGGGLSLGSTVTLAVNPAMATESFSQVIANSFRAHWSSGTGPWNPPGTLYDVDVSSDAGFGFVVRLSTVGLEIPFVNLAANTVYYARVRAVNQSGSATSFVNMGSTRTLAALPSAQPPLLLSSDTIRAQWGTNGNPAGTLFENQISTNGFVSILNTTSTTLSSMTWTDLLPDTLYSFQVRAFNADNVATAFVDLGSTRTAVVPFNTGGSSTTLQSGDGSVTVHVPENTFSEDYRLSLSTDPVGSPLASPQLPAIIAAAQEKLADQGAVSRTPLDNTMAEMRAETLAGSPLAPSAELTVTLSYPSADGENVDNSAAPNTRTRTLALYRLDESKSLWIRLPSSQVDQAGRTVTASASTTGVFAVMGQQDTSLETAYAYPVPFRRGRGDDTITFSDLAQRVTIKIFNAAGRWVRTLEETDGDGEFAWDARDRDGDPLPSGVYFYLLETSIDKKRGKLVIIGGAP